MVRVNLGVLEETLLVTLWARAWDAQRRAPMLGDGQALALVKQLDYDFSRFEGSIGTRIGITVRATVLEDEVKRLLALHPTATVVELGAGLSSRYERIDNGQARWVELDLPNALALRKHFFESGPRRRMIAGSVLDRDWIEPVRRLTRGRPLIFVAEGVLPYFFEGDVRGLLRTLCWEFPGSYLVFDSTSSNVVAEQQYLRTLKGTRARFSWGLGDPADLRRWNSAYDLRSSLSLRASLKQEQQRLPLALRLMYPLIDRLRPALLDGYRVNVMRFSEPTIKSALHMAQRRRPAARSHAMSH